MSITLLLRGKLTNLNNGLIIMWGLDANTTPYLTKRITLSLSLTHTGLPVVITDHIVEGSPGNVFSGAGILNKSTMHIGHSMSYSCCTNYIIVGY